jgi:hypothetical protein
LYGWDAGGVQDACSEPQAARKQAAIATRIEIDAVLTA